MWVISLFETAPSTERRGRLEFLSVRRLCCALQRKPVCQMSFVQEGVTALLPKFSVDESIVRVRYDVFKQKRM